MNLSNSIDYFRKQAKSLCRSVATGEPSAISRLQRFLKDSASLGLTKCQYVIAREHGFSSWDALIHAEDIERRLAITMLREPTLNAHGVSIYDGYLKLPPDERQRVLRAERIELRKSVEEVKRTYEWLLSNLPPVKTASRGVSSYALKHVAEGDIGYITNGVFIAAALIARYPQRFHGGPNLEFGVSLRALKAIEARQVAAGTRISA